VQVAKRLFERAVFQGALDQNNQVLVVDGLGNIVKRSQFGCPDGIAAGRVSGHDDHCRFARSIPKPLQNRETIKVGKPDIQQDQVRLLPQGQTQPFLARFGLQNLIALV